jgi:phenylalanyl-tRNA synthetase beta chain
MRVSLRWLNELVPGLKASAREVAERLTHAGLEVESMRELGPGQEPIVVAEVRRIEPHPSRSGLRLVTVNRGGGNEQRVVCGADNVPEPGGQVLLAPLGTVLPAIGITLGAREIAGVSSEGMLVSESELGLAEESAGIIVFEPKTHEPGTAMHAAEPESSDAIFEIGVTPNRPDALGHMGVARDVAALFELAFAVPEAKKMARGSSAKLSELVSVDNQDTERCPHYGAGAVLEVKVAPSPAWLRWRLSKLGVRAISNVVDITNLLLLGWGQPLHAFDLERVRGAKIVVRRAKSGEPFTTLDGVERKLDADDLVICDGEGPSALAGVMGGLDSEIRDTTTRVLLECAYFTPRGVRRTSRRHALHTESSFRFERGVDWGGVPLVLDHAKSLVTELCGGAAVDGAIHAKGPEQKLPSIRVRAERIEQLLGRKVEFEQAKKTFVRLGFALEQEGDGEATVRGASFRPDVSREVDLIEEVARMDGLAAIPAILPAILPQPPRVTGKFLRRVAAEAVGLGLSEALTYSFVSPAELEAVSAPPASVTLINPLTDERSVMRTSLLPGVLEALRRARRHGEHAVRLFAIGARFLPPGNDGPPSEARPHLAEDAGVLPSERPSFAAVLAGPRPAHLAQPTNVDVFDAKGIGVELVERLTLRSASVRHTKDAKHLHPRGAGEILVEGKVVGRFGPLHPDVIDKLDLGGEAFAIELDLVEIEALGARTPRFQPIPRLPQVARDVALVVSDDVSAEQVESVIRETAGELCESVELFDLFRGGSIPSGHQSLAFHVVYRDPKARTDPENAKTLTDREVDQRHAAVIKAANEKLGGQLRA